MKTSSHIIFFRKFILLLVVFMLFQSCSEDDNSSGHVEEVQLQEGLTQINIEIELPKESVYVLDELTINSLFTSENILNGSTSDAVVFDDNSMELIMVTDTNENMVLAAYVNPSNNTVLEINTETTAAAIALMHPWTFDLSLEEKELVYQQMRSYPGFENYHNQVISGIKTGNLDILVLDSFAEELIQANSSQNREQVIVREPLVFQIDQDSVITINKNSVAYTVALYDDQEQHLVQDLASGVPLWDRTLGWSDGNWSNGDSKNRASLPIPTNGEYTIKAKNGLSFDGTEENQQAAYYNMRDLGADVLGIFSTTLRDGIKGIDCMKGVGELLFDGGDNSIGLASSIKAYSERSKNGWVLSVDVIKYMYNRYESIASAIKSCDSSSGNVFADKFPSIENSFLGKFFAFLDVIEKMENVYNTAGFVTDWIQYDMEIEYCFEKTDEDIEECNFPKDKILGSWNICLYERILFPTTCASYDEQGDCGTYFNFKEDNSFTVPVYIYEYDANYSFDGATLEATWIFHMSSSNYGDFDQTLKFKGTMLNKNLIVGEYYRTTLDCKEGWRAELRR